MQLGSGVYDGKNVAKSMAMVKKAVQERLSVQCGHQLCPRKPQNGW